MSPKVVMNRRQVIEIRVAAQIVRVVRQRVQVQDIIIPEQVIRSSTTTLHVLWHLHVARHSSNAIIGQIVGHVVQCLGLHVLVLLSTPHQHRLLIVVVVVVVHGEHGGHGREGIVRLLRGIAKVSRGGWTPEELLWLLTLRTHVLGHGVVHRRPVWPMHQARSVRSGRGEKSRH